MSLMSFFKSELIEFFCEPEDFGVIPPPVPAYKMMPEWFKRIPVSTNAARDHMGGKVLTAKKCLPMIDAMSAGFIMPLFGDVNVRTNADCSLIEVGGGIIGPVIEFHKNFQLGGKSSPSHPGPAIKFINRWVVKTAPGYSVLFMPPLNHIEPRFTCFSGLVATDRYPKQVNFPGIWHAKNHDEILPAGTPLVVCIPIKRSDIPRTAPVREMTAKERREIQVLQKCQQSRRGVYSNELVKDKKCPF